ncbi:MAG: hypothetical protein DRO39_06680 [Thermoprotei archaeon]|nr:MAG: hypothetical protein DRO39_06680 [Thermoprotei archaeon]
MKEELARKICSAAGGKLVGQSDMLGLPVWVCKVPSGTSVKAYTDDGKFKLEIGGKEVYSADLSYPLGLGMVKWDSFEFKGLLTKDAHVEIESRTHKPEIEIGKVLNWMYIRLG